MSKDKTAGDIEIPTILASEKKWREAARQQWEIQGLEIDDDALVSYGDDNSHQHVWVQAWVLVND
jgi:hypothetical protein